MNVWWSGGPYWNNAFLDLAFDTMGFTILRTELYPQPDQTAMYTQQLPYLNAVRQYAHQRDLPFKFIASIWSPPGRMKSEGTATAGFLIKDSTTAYARYVVDYVKRFRADVGADLHAVSPQNEPAICTGYNSCCYLPEDFAPVVVAVGRAMDSSGVPTFVHWPDNIWWHGNWQGPVYQAVMADPSSRKVCDIMSWHYGDVNESQMVSDLSSLRDEAQGGARTFRMWNTEFGGFYDDWNGKREDEFGNMSGGAYEQAVMMFQEILFSFSALVWWQMSEPPQPNADGRHYALLYHDASGRATMGPRAQVMRHFSRFVRPGAVRIGCTASDGAVWCLAFKHPQRLTTTVVLLNHSSVAATATLAGSGLPSTLKAYRTGPADTWTELGPVSTSASIAMPARAIVTLTDEALYNTAVGVTQRPAIRHLMANSAPAARVFCIDGREVRGTPTRAVGAGMTIVRSVQGTVARTLQNISTR